MCAAAEWAVPAENRGRKAKGASGFGALPSAVHGKVVNCLSLSIGSVQPALECS